MPVSRSPFRTKRNPWPSDEHVNECLFLRGSYVAAIGAVEAMLTEVAVAASKEAAYAGLRASFPTRRGQRIDYLRKVAATPGPLSQYRRLMEAVLDRFEAATELRDICAHAHQRIHSGLIANAHWQVCLTDWYANGPTIAYRERRVTDTVLRRSAIRAASFSRAITWLHQKARPLLPALEYQTQLKPPFGRLRLDGITDFAVKAFVKSRRAAGAAPSSINRELATLSHLFSSAVTWRWIGRDKVPTIERLKEGAGRIIALSPEQCSALLAAAIGDQDPDLWLFVLVGLHTSMRHSEIRRLRWEHFDAHRRRFFIPQAKAGERE